MTDLPDVIPNDVIVKCLRQLLRKENILYSNVGICYNLMERLAKHYKLPLYSLNNTDSKVDNTLKKASYHKIKQEFSHEGGAWEGQNLKDRRAYIRQLIKELSE